MSPATPLLLEKVPFIVIPPPPASIYNAPLPNSQKGLERLFLKGERGRHPLLMVVVLRGQPEKTFGCNVLKGVKGSVIRNRLKRRLRAIGRRYLPACQEGIQVFVLSTPRSVTASYQELEHAFLVTAKKMGLLQPGAPQ